MKVHRNDLLGVLRKKKKLDRGFWSLIVRLVPLARVASFDIFFHFGPEEIRPQVCICFCSSSVNIKRTSWS